MLKLYSHMLRLCYDRQDREHELRDAIAGDISPRSIMWSEIPAF